MIDEGYIRTVAGADTEKAMADVMNQNTAMWLESTDSLTNTMGIAKEVGFNLNTNFIPGNPNHGVPTGGCNLVMTTGMTEKQKMLRGLLFSG